MHGTLRSGQSLESDASVVVVEDAESWSFCMCQKGNVVVLGCAKGYLSAGNGGDSHAFVAARHAADADPYRKTHRKKCRWRTREEEKAFLKIKE